MNVVVERRRTGWDVVIGVLLTIAGIIVLAHTVLATTVSVVFLGWLALISGVIALVAAVFQIGSGGIWPAAISGGLMAVLGLMIVRNPGVGAVARTMVAGAFFLASGVIRLMASANHARNRWLLISAGIASVVLGLIVVFNLIESTFTLLGTLLGIALLVDGLTILLAGRLRAREVPGQ